MWLFSLTLLFFFTLIDLPRAHAQLLGPNLIANPSFESSTLAGAPADWSESAATGNAGRFTYPALPAKNGLKAARFDVIQYAGGDVAWRFKPVAVVPGDYIYIDWYKASAPSVIEAEFRRTGGATEYADISILPPTEIYTEAVVDIPVPQGVRALSVAHVLRGEGSLTIDDTWLCLRAPMAPISQDTNHAPPDPKAAIFADLTAKPTSRSRK